jgi:hypothetical protein
MKSIKLFCIAVIFLSYPISVLGSDSYDKAISDATIYIVKELKYMNQLNGKTIAVCGFHDANSGEGCRPLSVSFANQIDSKINEIKNLLDISFRTVPRHALDSIETEYLISKGRGDRDIFSLLKSSDILITGIWQDQDDSLKLTIKAVAIKNDDIDQLSAVSKEIDKKTIPQNHLICLGEYVELRPKPSHRSIEKIGVGEMDWGTKVLRVKGFGAANKAFPKQVWKKSAEEAAIVDAQAKLIEVVEGFKLESKTFVKNYQISKDEKVKEIKGKLKRVKKVGKTVYPTDDTAEVVVQIDLSDVFY